MANIQLCKMFLAVIISLCVLTECKKHRKRITRCRSLTNVDFDLRWPRRQSLPFCNQYKKKTCCSPSHAHKIFNTIKPLLKSNDISQKCKQMTIDIWCSSCHPLIGTHHLHGICTHYCDEWYHQCQNEYYYVDMYGQLQACQDNSDVCSPLNRFIGSGQHFCELSGFETNHVCINCFDGHTNNRGRIDKQRNKTTQLKDSSKNRTNKNLFHEPLVVPIKPRNTIRDEHQAPYMSTLRL
eukprot:51344_1